MAGKNTDTRIVQLQFENREFERRIAKSTKSVEELKEAMDFEETSRGLEKFANATNGLDFSKLEDNIQRLTDKFTGLGNMGEYIVSRIRHTLESGAREIEEFVRNISVAQIPVGQNKYDEMNKAVMTIISSGKASEDAAYGTMERIMTYTDQTSHSFNTMVAQLSNLTSIGYDMNEAERLLEGIGNAATYAGQGAENAALSMGVLTKTLGPESFLGYEKFLQLSSTARVITDKWREQALEAAAAVGTLKKKNDQFFVDVKGQKAVQVTAENLENTLKYRWLTGKALAELYKNYEFGNKPEDLQKPTEAALTGINTEFSQKAYLTGQRALTFVDALNAIKESVSSGWMKSFRLLFGDVTEAAEHFTNIADRIIEFIEKIQIFRNNLLQQFGANGRKSIMRLLLGGYEEDAAEEVYGFIDALEDLGKLISDAFWDFVSLFVPENLKELWNDKDFIKDNGREGFLAATFMRIIDSIRMGIQNVRDYFNENIDFGGKTKTRLEVVYEILRGIGAVLKFGYDILVGLIYFASLIGGQLSPSFDAILSFLGNLGQEIYETEDNAGKTGKVKRFFIELGAAIKPVTDGINSCVESITKLLNMLFGLDKDNKQRTDEISGIGKALIAIADIISKVAGPILEFLASIINLITDVASGKISFKDFGKNLAESFKTMMKSFADNLPESLGFVGNAIRDLFGLWEDESQGDSKSFFSFLHRLFTGGFSSFGEVLGQLTNGFSLSKALETGFGFGSAFNFLNTLIGWFKGTNLYSVFLAFLGVTSIVTLLKLINRIKLLVTNMSVFFDDVGGNLAAGFTGQYEWFGERVLKIAKSIALFAVAIMILGSMDTGRMIQGIAGLAAVMVMLGGLLKYLSSWGTSATLGQQFMIEALIITLSGAVLAIAAAISILSLALIPLSSDPKKMATAVVGFAAIMAIFGFFLKIMIDTFDTKAFAMGATNQWSGVGKIAVMILTLSASLIAISAAVSTLVLAITPLTLTGWGGLFRAIIGVGAFLAMLGVFIVVMINQMDLLAFNLGGGAKGAWTGIGKMVVMMLALSATVALLAVGIGALVVAITPLALMSWGGFIRAVAGLGIILLELSAMIKFIQAMSVGDKTVSIKIAGLTGFAFSLGVLVYALIPLAAMNWGGWARSIGGLAVVLAELAGFLKLMQLLKVDLAPLLGFAAFAASVGILLLSMQALANMDWGGWARAVAGLAVVMLEIIGFIKLAQLVKVDGVALGGFIGFALSIAVLIFALKPLSEMTPEGYMRALVGLGTVMLEIIVLMAVMKEIQPDLKTAGSTLLLLIGLGASMILFGMAFNEVKDVPWERLLSFAGAIAILLLAIAGASVIAKVGGIAGMVVLAAGVAMLVGVIALLAPLVGGSLSSTLQMLAGSLNRLTAMFESFGRSMNGIDEGTIGKSERMIDRLKNVFSSLFAFSIYSQGISAFSTAMYDLSTGFEIFQRHSGNANELKNNGALALIDQLSANAKKLDTIASLNIDSLTAKISGLGGAMSLYAKGAKEATGLELGETPDVTAAVQLMTSISDTLATEEGNFKIPTDLPTPDSIGVFGAQLAALASAMVEFEKAGKGLGTGTENAKKTITFFKELKLELDENFYTNLKEAVSAFGEGENAFIPSQLEEFGKNIEQLAGSMALFAEKTTTVDKTTGEVKPVDFDSAIAALTSFSNLQTKLPKIGGIKQWILEGNPQTLADLGADIETIGNNLAALSEKVNGSSFDPTSVDTAVTATGKMVNAMSDIAYKLPKVGGLGKIISTVFTGRETNLEDIGTELGKLGNGLSEFGQKIQGKFQNVEDVTNALGAVDGITSLVMKFASMDTKVYSGNLVDYVTTLNMFLDGFLNGVKDMNGDTEYYGALQRIVEIMDWISTEINKNPAINSDALQKFELLTQALGNLAAIDLTNTENFEHVGTSIATGIATGMTKGTNIVTEAARALASAAYVAAMDELKAASPSKVFIDVGSYVGLGMARGIDNSSVNVVRSAEDMAQASVTAVESSVSQPFSGMSDDMMDTARDMIGLISRIMAEGTDASPTIAPVLDMTNIDAGMDEFRRSLTGYGMSLDTTLVANRAGRIGTSAYEDPQALTTAPDFTGIYDRMAQMNAQIASLGDSIRQMRLVLDTGVVAGGITDQIDTNLGLNEFYAGRRN